MDQYQLGKDIQTILEMLKSIQASLASKEKKRCTCGSFDTGGVLTASGTRELTEEGGKKVTRRYKSFTWGENRVGKCDWVSASVTIYDNGDYENNAHIHCDHGVLFACTFDTRMDYKGSDGHVFTTSSWSRGVAGTDSADIRDRGWRQAIRDSFDGITTMNQHMECTD